MTKVTLNQLRAFFNLDQWLIRWYKLDTPQAMSANHTQAVQIMGDSPDSEGAPCPQE